MGLEIFFFLVTPKLAGSENDAWSVLYMSNGILSPGSFVILWLTVGASFPAWLQLSVTATAVILPGEGKVMAWERYFCAEF